MYYDNNFLQIQQLDHQQKIKHNGGWTENYSVKMYGRCCANFVAQDRLFWKRFTTCNLHAPLLRLLLSGKLSTVT